MKAFKIFVNIVLICIIIFAIYIIISNIYTESKIKIKEDITGTRTSAETETKNTDEGINIILNKTEDQEIIRDIEPRKLKYVKVLYGYNVIAKLEVPKIKLNTDILEKYTNSALKTSVTKFTGPNPNEVGNFCVTGHNYINNNMFSNLKKLEKGDYLYLIDGYEKKVEYKVYDVFKVAPNDESVLSQDTNGAREVTLITCTSSSKERIIVKAREV